MTDWSPAGSIPRLLAASKPPAQRQRVVFEWGRFASPRFRVAFGFVLAMTAAFLLTTSRERPAGREADVYFTAERLVLHGTTSLDFPERGPANSRTKTSSPLLVSLVHVPGVLLKRLWTPVWRAGEAPLLMFSSHLAPAVLGAGTCWLFLQLSLLLGLRGRLALLTSVILGFGTIIWVYARSPLPSIVEAFVFTGFFGSCLAWLKQPKLRGALALGLWTLALINVNWSFVILLPFTSAWIVWRTRADRRSLLHLLSTTLPLALLGCGLALFESKMRFGAWTFITGMVWNERAREATVMGLWTLLLSPGKSLLIYSPPLVLGILGLSVLWRGKQIDVLALLAATVVPFLIYLANLPQWTGDWAWGPRLCVFMTPVLLLPAGIYIHDLWCQRKVLGLALAASLIAVGLNFQVLGNAVHWSHYLEVANQARIGWLGVPDRTGALVNPAADAECEPCFEDVYPMTWLAPFNPIAGHSWLLGHLLKGDDATKAEADADWHRHTGLVIPIAGPYSRARIDWWFLDFLPKQPVKGIASLLALVGLFGLGVAMARNGRGALRRQEP